MNRHNDCLGGVCAPRLCRYHQHIPNGRRFEADTIAFAAAKIPFRREKTNFSRLNLPHCVQWGTIRPEGGLQAAAGVSAGRRAGMSPKVRVAKWRMGDGVTVKSGGRAAEWVTDGVVSQDRNGVRQNGWQGEGGRMDRKGRATDGAMWQGGVAWSCGRASRQGRKERKERAAGGGEKAGRRSVGGYAFPARPRMRRKGRPSTPKSASPKMPLLIFEEP